MIMDDEKMPGAMPSDDDSATPAEGTDSEEM